MPVLARAWQMLLKGLTEVEEAPSPLQAVEMVLVRLAYVADLPAPADILRALESGGGSTAAAPRAPTAPTRGPAATASASPTPASFAPRNIEADPGPGGAPRLALATQHVAALPVASPGATPATASAPETLPQPQSFEEVIALFDQHREAVLRMHLYSHVHLVRFEAGRIEFRPTELAPRNLANRLGELLGEWTGTRWLVSISGEPGAPTLREQAAARALQMSSEAAQHPVVRAVLDTFPGAVIETVREVAPPEAPGAEATPPDEAPEEEESP
jgi:DNA polymerase-3 subunit gamma/tau